MTIALDANDLLIELTRAKAKYGSLIGIPIDAYVTEEAEKMISESDLIPFTLVMTIPTNVNDEFLHSIQISLGGVDTHEKGD